MKVASVTHIGNVGIIREEPHHGRAYHKMQDRQEGKERPSVQGDPDTGDRGGVL